MKVLRNQNGYLKPFYTMFYQKIISSFLGKQTYCITDETPQKLYGSAFDILADCLNKNDPTGHIFLLIYDKTMRT